MAKLELSVKVNEHFHSIISSTSKYNSVQEEKIYKEVAYEKAAYYVNL